MKKTNTIVTAALDVIILKRFPEKDKVTKPKIPAK